MREQRTIQWYDTDLKVLFGCASSLAREEPKLI
jgi:hypothetical protein